jgi:hypothetical protein
MRPHQCFVRRVAHIAIGAVVLVITGGVPSIAQATRDNAGGSALDIRLMQPVHVMTGDNPFEVIVKMPPDGHVVSDADVSVSFVMSAWPVRRIPEIRRELRLKSASDGRYTGSWKFERAGRWVTTIRVTQDRKEIGRKRLILTAP